MIEFLSDSGASRSSLRPCDLPRQPSLTEKTNESISASGHTIFERFTVPLNCETEGGRVLKHAFIYSPNCPVPLMGRDLMCKLNLTLVADSSGVRVTEEEQLCCLQTEPQWAYEWRILNNDWAQMMCELAKNQTEPSNIEIMLPDNLHCTSHVVVEPAKQYDKDWFNGEKEETLSLDKIFWTENVCAVSVCLTKKQFQFCLIAEDSVPHLSLSKAREQTWSEVGVFVKNCVDATDWCEISASVKHSESLGAFMSECKCEIEVERVVTPIDKSTKENHCMANICVSDIHPALAVIPSDLWAKNKYDVGLIKGCEPVVITPKSDYRPCQCQYPLKPEAIVGITPVFESLWKEGIVEPCNDSPVCTNFSCEKDKRQFAKQQVTLLGHVITPNSKSLSEKRVQAIRYVPKPITKKQMFSFLGMCSYCRSFIPNYAILEQPLRALTIGKGLKSTDKIDWRGGRGGICEYENSAVSSPNFGPARANKAFCSDGG